MYTNEILFLFPGPLWLTVRSHLLQRIVDILRTVPLASLAVVYATTGSVSLFFQLFVLIWTISFNAIMYVVDKALAPNKFHLLTYALSQISIINWIAGRSALNIATRAFCVAINVFAGLYFAAAIFVAFPISQAFMCYPSKDPATFNFGYCPQYTGDYMRTPALNPCTVRANDQIAQPRCDPKFWGEFTSMHDTLSSAGHVSFAALAISATIHFAQILPAAERARVKSCLKAADIA